MPTSARASVEARAYVDVGIRARSVMEIVQERIGRGKNPPSNCKAGFPRVVNYWMVNVPVPPVSCSVNEPEFLSLKVNCNVVLALPSLGDSDSVALLLPLLTYV